MQSQVVAFYVVTRDTDYDIEGAVACVEVNGDIDWALAEARRTAQRHVKSHPGAQTLIVADHGVTEGYSPVERHPVSHKPKEPTVRRYHGRPKT